MKKVIFVLKSFALTTKNSITQVILYKVLVTICFQSKMLMMGLQYKYFFTVSSKKNYLPSS